MALLSIVIPVYNEKKTIRKILDKINSLSLNKEIVIVDNFSTDGTREILKDIEKQKMAKVIYHPRNLGKGTSVQVGINAARGDFIVIQDADLEYEPADYPRLIKPLLDGGADLVLGVRFIEKHSGIFIHQLGNKFLTAMINMLFACRLNDYSTCYKMARREIFKDLNINSKSFDLEVEIICKALKKRLRIEQVPVSYYPRSYEEGKKIRWNDGIHAIIAIIGYRIGLRR